MAFFTIQVDDLAVKNSLQALASRINNLGPILKEIGEDLEDDAKRRFETSRDPDGNRWAPNARATIEAMISRRGGIGKSGKINKKGVGLAMSKKPLIGESGDLRRKINHSVAGNTLTISASPFYAAIQQFGGVAGRGKKVTIPARPFLPIYKNGVLYWQTRAKILDTLNSYLAGKF